MTCADTGADSAPTAITGSPDVAKVVLGGHGISRAGGQNRLVSVPVMLTSHACSRTATPASSDLVRALNAEWAQLRQQPQSDAAVQRWAVLEPALAGAGALTDVERLAAGHADQVLVALLRLTHGGDALAGRVLLQLQLGAAVNLALRTVHHAGGDLEEAKARAVTCLWEVIAAYPLPRRRGNHAAGLALDLLSRLTSHTDHRPGRALRQAALLEVPQEDLLQSLAECPEPDVEPDPAGEVLELLRWAVRRQVLTDSEADLLRRLHTSGPSRELTQAALARQLGLSYAALRQRTSRATRRLAEAVQRDRTAPTSSPATAPPDESRLIRNGWPTAQSLRC